MTPTEAAQTLRNDIEATLRLTAKCAEDDVLGVAAAVALRKLDAGEPLFPAKKFQDQSHE